MDAVVWRLWQERQQTVGQAPEYQRRAAGRDDGDCATWRVVWHSGGRFRMFGAGVCTGIGGPEKLMSPVQPMAPSKKTVSTRGIK